MNTLPLPNEINRYFLNFLDFSTLKSIGLTSKDFYALRARSQNYAAPFLSTYFTKALPQDQEAAAWLQLCVTEIWSAIANNNFYIERPVTIHGKQLYNLPAFVSQSTDPAPAVVLKLLLNDWEDTRSASDPHNASLLPCVHSVEFSDDDAPVGNYERHKSITEKQLMQLLPLLQKMARVQVLILRTTNDITSEKFSFCQPCQSVNELQVYSPRDAHFSHITSTKFLELFPKVKKIVLHDVYMADYTHWGKPAQNSLVKELVFVNSPINGFELKQLLNAIPTVEKIVVHAHECFSALPFCLSKLDTNPMHKAAPSVKELHISDPKSVYIVVNDSYYYDTNDGAYTPCTHFYNVDEITDIFLRWFPIAKIEISESAAKQISEPVKTIGLEKWCSIS
jgi:hypothetical protein